TGSRVVMWSWKTIAMRRPRILRIRPELRVARSTPSNSMRPPTMRAPAGRIRSTLSAVMLLPDPDSPTMPTISPGRTSNATCSRMRTLPWGLEMSCVRSCTASGGVGAVCFVMSVVLPGVDGVTDSVSDRHRRQDSDGDHETGGHPQPWDGREDGEGLCLVEHVSPAGLRRLDTGTEERQRRD